MKDLPFADDDIQFPVPGMIVLSEASFGAALQLAARAGRDGPARWSPVDPAAAEAGAIIAGRANHPGTRGLLARVKRGGRAGVPFEGRLFGIVTDPVFAPGGQLVSAGRFRIATIELKGTADWIGGDARFSGKVAAVGAGVCCGPATACVPMPGGGDDPPVLMPSGRVGVSPHVADLYTAREREYPKGGTVPYTAYGGGYGGGAPGQPNRAGIPPVPGAGGGRAAGGPPGPPMVGGRGPLPAPLGDDLVCVNRLDPDCTIAKPVCGPDDIGYSTTDDGAADIPLGSSSCVGQMTRPVRGLNVPEACTFAYFGGDTTDSACRGTYGGPPHKAQWLPHTLPPGAEDAANSLLCLVARWVPGSGSPCETQTTQYQLARTIALQLEMGGVLPGQTKTQCTDTGHHGIEVCVTCTSDSCSESVVVPDVDPTIAAGTQKSTDDKETEIDVDELVWTTSNGVTTVTTQTSTYQVQLPSSPNPAPASDPPKNPQPASQTPPPPKTPEPKAPPSPGRQPPDPGKEPTHTSTDLDQGRGQRKDYTKPRRQESKKGGDPVEYGDGSLLIDQTDLEFPGPVRPLTFSRSYRSSSRDRSSLGSNWRHNWDVRLQVYDEATIPSWVSPWCAGLPGMPTAVAVHWGDGSSDLFLLDIGTRLFLPHAGSPATVGRTATGWAMRFPDGRILAFDDVGCLVSDSDRFGTAFVIDWEYTPLGRLFDYFCAPAQLAARNETLAARRNCLLAWLVGAVRRPDADKRFWEVTAADFPIPATDPDRAALEYARDYLLSLAALPYPAESIDGGTRRRVRRVTDPIGRTLEFTYKSAAGYVAQPGPAAFASAPAAGLLDAVHGLVGTSVTFTYDRPTGYPQELNEAFLTTVLRSDTVPAGVDDVVDAPSRETTFEYQWPASGIVSYHGFENKYETSYVAYYRTFIGCRFDGVYMCGQAKQTVAEWAPGNPVFLAHLTRNAYISDVADNILTVTHAGEVELESRYPADPAYAAFDRVVAQRYGSSRAVQDPARIAPDNPGDAWRTSYPKATIAYCTAGPVAGGGDATDAFLPAAIRARYPLETAPTLAAPVPPANSKTGGCNYALMEQLREQLPGHRDALPYFDRPEAPPPQTFEMLEPAPFGAVGGSATAVGSGTATAVAPAHATDPAAGDAPLVLWRTPLAPEQLAGAQLWDPTHNDLISGQVANPADASRPFVERIVGRRQVIARNNNRICAWVERVDRDGDVVFFGLNYRGQALVEATRDASGAFVFVDRVYNADGNLVEERRPTRALVPWRHGDGRIVYAYDDIDPTGQRGWNGWLPVFWARRFNLLRVETQPMGDVLDFDEQGSFGVGTGRFTQYRYEPLFNQVASTMSGSIAPGAQLGSVQLPPVATVSSVTASLFDYQELSESVPATDPGSIDPLLDSLRPWGFRWLRDDPQAFAFQLQLPLLGADINKDGGVGNRFASTPSTRGVGVPVLHLQGRPGGAGRGWFLRWSPHGKICRIDGPDGESTRFEFYAPVPGDPAAALGTTTPPADADVQTGSSGYLGRIVHQVAAPLGFATPALTRVPALAGPYAFLGIDPATTAADLPAALGALGLPAEQVADVIATLGTNPAAAASMRALSYNRAGHPSRVFLPGGTAVVVTDTDGRITEVTDARGTEVVIDYDVQRRPIGWTTRNSAAKLIAQTLTAYDEEDNIVLRVEALAPGAATNPPPTQNAVVWRHTYTPEGDLSETQEPEGLRRQYAYDEFKRLRLERWDAGPGAEVRTTGYSYDVAGRLERTTAAGTSWLGPTASQLYTYDGLDRLVSIRDERRYLWQQAWSRRDLLTHQQRSDQPYGTAAVGVPSREQRFAYDDFGELAEQHQNGVLRIRLQRTPGGRILSRTSEGLGVRHEINDLLGRLVWSRDPDATETVVTRSEQPHRSITSVIRRDANGAAHTTSTLSELEVLGAATKIVRVGGTHRVETTFALDGAGRIEKLLGPNGETVGVRRNLAGWVTHVTRAGAAGGVDTLTEYDRRGLTTRILDAAGQDARFEYNAFGELILTSLNGTPAVTSTRAYDRLGRIIRSTDGAFSLIHRYDARHDPVEDVTPAGVLVQRRTFDDLGRLTSLVHTNPGLTWLPEGARTVQTRLLYDGLDRVRWDETRLLGVVGEVTHGWTTATAGRRCVTSATLGAWQATLERLFDRAGRFASCGPIGQPLLHAQFRWLGDAYLGRSQAQSGWQSRFTEQVELDAFLTSRRVSYRAIETDAQGLAVHTADGLKYSPTGWDNARCSRPLLDITTLRDRVGRVAAETWQHAHVTATQAGLDPPAPPRLRAATYTLTGRLASYLENDALTTPLPVLDSYSDPAPAIAALAAGAASWTYDRTTETEDLSSITDAAGASRFGVTAPRTLAHQLTDVKVDGQALTVSHDDGGRLTSDSDRSFSWHPDGRLATVERGATFLEGYAYDGFGRLIGLYASQAVPEPGIRLTHDGDEPIAATAGLKPIWQATWGALANQLIGWEAGGGVQIPLLDGRASPLAVWDPGSATVRAVNTYTPEGRITVRDDVGAAVCDEIGTGTVCLPAGLPFGFTGAFRSSVTGLFWMRARWYDPRLAQFLSMDPAWFTDGTNRYEYAAGDPINRIDPTGLASRGNARKPPKPKGNPVLSGPGPQVRDLKPKPSAPMPPTVSKPPAFPVKPPPPNAGPPKLPPGGMSDAERAIIQKKKDLQKGKTLQQQAETDKELREGGWKDRTKELEFKELLDKSTVPEQLAYEIGEQTGGNELAVGVTGADKHGDDVPLADRIVAGVSGLLTMLDIATTALMAGAVVKRTGKAVMVEVAPGVFRPGIRMPKAFPWQSASEEGFLRDNRRYWRWMNEHYPELFSEKNREFIKRGWAPEVDKDWLKHFPEQGLLEGDLLEHHHWDKGADTVGIPQFLHDLWHSELHY